MRKATEKTVFDEAFDLFESAGYDLQNITGNDGILKDLTKQLVERALKAELSAHLSHEEGSNSRNGFIDKRVISGNGSFAIKSPRDRDSSFAPILVPKRSNMIKGLDEKILSLYAKGMSVSDIP